MRIIFFFIIIISKSFSYGQINTKLFIKEKGTKEKIKNATIYLLRLEILVAADSNGIVNVYSQPNDIIKITCVGYKEKTYKISSNFDTVFLEKNITVLQPIVISPSKLLVFKNSTTINNSWKIQPNTHFFTSFQIPCDYTTIYSFTIFQFEFISDVNITLSFYEDSIGLPSRRISPYYISNDKDQNKGKITFKFDPPIVLKNKEKLFFEIARIKWPTNKDIKELEGDVSIKFTFRDKVNYTLKYFNNSFDYPYILDRHFPRLYVDSTSITQYPKHGNPIFEYKYRCKEIEE